MKTTLFFSMLLLVNGCTRIKQEVTIEPVKIMLKGEQAFIHGEDTIYSPLFTEVDTFVVQTTASFHDCVFFTNRYTYLNIQYGGDIDSLKCAEYKKAEKWVLEMRKREDMLRYYNKRTKCK